MNYKESIPIPRRDNDEKLEQIAASFIDKYFWGKTPHTIERVYDKERQFAGEDLIVNGKLIIDEKVKNASHINKRANAPSVEILTTDNATHTYDCKGWFIKPDMKTNVYAFITIYSTNTNPNTIKEEDITEVEYFMFPKKGLTNYIGNDIYESLWDEAVDLKHNGTPNHNGKITRKVGQHFLSYSFKKREQPVNYVIPWEDLDTIPHMQYSITRDGFRKIA